MPKRPYHPRGQPGLSEAISNWELAQLPATPGPRRWPVSRARRWQMAGRCSGSCSSQRGSWSSRRAHQGPSQAPAASSIKQAQSSLLPVVKGHSPRGAKAPRGPGGHFLCSGWCRRFRAYTPVWAPVFLLPSPSSRKQDPPRFVLPWLPLRGSQSHWPRYTRLGGVGVEAG